MQRDKYGRFVKKASIGSSLTPTVTPITIDGVKYNVSGDAKKAYRDFQKKYKTRYTFEQYLANDGKAFLTPFDENTESADFNTWSTTSTKSLNGVTNNVIDKTKLADFLEYTRAGIGAGVNNQIAERALEAEKPFLQDVSESHRAVYGDYRAQIQGERSAAQLRNMASKPLTSDGSLQQQMMLDAQIKGQEFIDQGNAKDDAMIRQTNEVAWQQEKENQQQRQAVAMQNRQALLMSEKNKAQIKNMRDSANYSQVAAPLMMGIESKLREKGVEQKQYQDYYDNLAITDDVWNNAKDYVTPEELELVTKFLSEGQESLETFIAEDTTKVRTTNWISAQNKLKKEITRRQAALRGVTLSSDKPQEADPYAMWRPEQTQWRKDGGTIYKATLQAKSRDKDRNQKDISSSKKLAARFLEKALNSLYTYNEVELIAKPKKRKYQAGGSLPFVNFTPMASPTVGAKESTKSKKEDKADTDLTTKDVLELLKDLKGLPSDINEIIASLKNFTLDDSYLPSSMASSSNIASRYIKLIGKIQTAKFNRDEYETALNQLKTNGGLHEYAITSDGLLIGVNNEGNFKYFDASQVNSGKPKQTGYDLLTNSNLLYLRANSPDAAFNHLLISAAQNGIGMEVITKQINEILQGLGSTKTSREGFVQMGTNTVVQGIEFLQQAAQAINDPELLNTMSVEDYYQAGYITESQAAEAQQALNYIYAALPANAQALLLVKGGSAEGAQMILQSLVNSKVKSATTFKATPKKMEEAKGSGSGSGKGKNSGMDMSPAQLLQQGFGERSLITIQDSTSTGLQVEAVALPITNDGNKAVGAATLEDVAGSQYGGVLDFTNASMGGVMIPFEGRRNIAVDGSKLYSMNLPVDYDEYATTGNIVPDFGLIDKVNALHKQIRSQQITDVTTINQMFEEAGLPVYYNDDGTINATVYRRFGVLNGTAIDNAFGSDFVSNKYLKEIDDENLINGAISIMNHGRSKEDRVEYDAKSFFNFGGLLGDYDSVYQGTIFIPISDSVFSGIAGSGQTVTPDEANLLEAKQQQHDRVSATYINPGQLQ